tara:strand:+ start:669 stop:1058 length:390 start_codon:yes stop_codon:yes gene_type:complete
MTYTLTKQFRFEAAHQLPNVPEHHPCFRLHGHSFVVEIQVGADELLVDGFVMDYKHISKYTKPIIKSLDHQLLNDFLPNPTSEHLCEYIANEWLKRARKDQTDNTVYLEAVTVSETINTNCRLTLNELI